jgi:hypothetical protein
MDRDVAIKVAELMLKIGAWVDQSVALVHDRSSDEEFTRYRRGAGEVLGTILTEVLNPIYFQHPDLKPKKLGGPYQVDERLYAEKFYDNGERS